MKIIENKYGFGEVSNITEYQCDVCGKRYTKFKHALECEKIPIEYPDEISVGDIIIITTPGYERVITVFNLGVYNYQNRHLVGVYFWNEKSRKLVRVSKDNYRRLKEEDIQFPSEYEKYVFHKEVN